MPDLSKQRSELNVLCGGEHEGREFRVVEIDGVWHVQVALQSGEWIGTAGDLADDWYCGEVLATVLRTGRVEGLRQGIEQERQRCLSHVSVRDPILREAISSGEPAVPDVDESERAF